MIKKRDLELHCPNGHIYLFSNERLGIYTWDKRCARLKYPIVQNGDFETVQIAPIKDLAKIARYLGNKDKSEILDYQRLIYGEQ